MYKDHLVRLCGELGIVVEDRRWKLGDGRAEMGSGKKGVGGRSTVRFVPSVPRDQLPPLYQQADVFCFPTLCDTYGIALLEAMSCGCAALVSDVAGAGEIVNGENGLKVPLRDPEQYIREYAEKIVMLATNPELRARLGSSARQFVLREHDWGRIGDQVLAVYRELAQGSARTPT